MATHKTTTPEMVRALCASRSTCPQCAPTDLASHRRLPQVYYSYSIGAVYLFLFCLMTGELAEASSYFASVGLMKS
jgi:hypothetical protein